MIPYKLLTRYWQNVIKTQPFHCSHYKANDSFLSGSSSQYIEDMYNTWLQNPLSVHSSWDSYFKNSSYQRPPLFGFGKNERPMSRGAASNPSHPGNVGNPSIDKSVQDHMAVQAVIRSYQSRGHLVAKLDPLGLMYSENKSTIADIIGVTPAEIVSKYKLTEKMMDQVFKLPPTTSIGGEETSLPLREILKRLQDVYCRHIGVEYMKINNHGQRVWIRSKIEPPGAKNISPEQRRLILSRLTRAAEFELFLARKWPSEKRFGIEGCEILIPAMKQIIDRCTTHGVESFILGLGHRGRLNILANICRKSLYQIFTQFAGLEAEDEGAGDVKYHLGTYIERLNRETKKNIKLSVMANPSHLEVVGCLTQGRTRSEQFYKGDVDGKRTMSIILHGDASFSGQGVVYETMHLSNLPEFTTHGTIHIVINNQIGFTTDPRFSRSSPYCTDVGHILEIPIFHVNADDPDSVIHVSNIAAEWRATYRKDVIIDLVCYRKNGHNEADEPMFTQPVMYTKIKSLKPILIKYAEQLIQEGVVTKAEFDDLRKKYQEILEADFAQAQKQTHIKFADWIDSPWSGFFEGRDPLKVKPTGIPEEVIVHIGTKFSSPPPSSASFVLHKGIERILRNRMQLVKARLIDWSLAEALAFGSLLKEGIHVRLSGQDVERGTFSHRHHVLHHQTVDKAIYCPIKSLYPDQAPYSVCNSSLSEYGVLGFEFGYSITNPNSLVMWEGQFGDFCNTGQCIIDQIIAQGQSKWVRQSGFVMLLPHGMEGMGSEHSSARPERFLQLTTDDPDSVPPEGPEYAVKQLRDTNLIIADCSTPANMFHVLRRQLALPFRKPLIIFTPKSLLRHPEVKSSFDELLVNTEFKRVIPHDGPSSKSPQDVTKLFFCTGKVFYNIRQALKEKKLENKAAICRIEQLCPFPYDLVKKEADKYPKAKVVFAQEEHKNHGFWPYMLPRLQSVLKGSRDVTYEGRPVSAATATGSKWLHKKEQEDFMAQIVTM